MLLVHGERRLAPSYDSGAPAEASAKSGDGDEVAGLDLALAHRRVERQRDGARARVAVLVQIGDHLLHRDAQLLRHSLHDAAHGQSRSRKRDDVRLERGETQRQRNG
eukprot:1120508-Pleurochrysis_carterae.AAC.4